MNNWKLFTEGIIVRRIFRQVVMRIYNWYSSSKRGFLTLHPAQNFLRKTATKYALKNYLWYEITFYKIIIKTDTKIFLSNHSLALAKAKV